MTAMKTIYFFSAFIFVILFQSCTATSDLGRQRTRDRMVDEASLNQAIESGRFIIKFDRMYTYGGLMHLRPRSNYLIVDGRNAIINTAYIGRQYDIRPIAGINMRGKTTEYEITRKVSRSRYEINMEVKNAANSFRVHLSIADNGSVSASMNNIRIDHARYSGYLVPLTDQNETLEEPEII